jgi:hypothetical protein
LDLRRRLLRSDLLAQSTQLLGDRPHLLLELTDALLCILLGCGRRSAMHLKI